MASFNATVRQMTEMFQRKKNSYQSISTWSFKPKLQQSLHNSAAPISLRSFQAIIYWSYNCTSLQLLLT